MKSRCVGVAQKKGAEFDKDFEWALSLRVEERRHSIQSKSRGPLGLFCILRCSLRKTPKHGGALSSASLHMQKREPTASYPNSMIYHTPLRRPLKQPLTGTGLLWQDKKGIL